MPKHDDLYLKLNQWAQEMEARGIELNELTRTAKLFAEIYDWELSEKDIFDTVAAVLDGMEVVITDGTSVTSSEFRPWFDSWRSEHEVPRWDRYAKYLLSVQGWSGHVIDGLDRETSQLIDLAGDPNINGEWRRRGLAIGEVQSGKTANYIGVLNKALDVGYKIIVVIGGHTNDLRRQTQERVDSDLLGFDTNYGAVEVAMTENSRASAAIGVGMFEGPLRPNYLTTVLGDFSKSNKSTQGVTIGNHPAVAVVKKHKGTLENLTSYLKLQARDGRLDAPLLVIDDESDWASVNTRTESDVVAVNKAIRELLAVSKRSSYMAITATPFANILIDSGIEDDLFPKDYIRALPSPSNYLGVEAFHSPDARREHPQRLQLNVDDLLDALPYNHKRVDRIGDLPESLRDAILAFFIGTAERRIRDGKSKPASMMINVSRFNDVQSDVEMLVSDYVQHVARQIQGELGTDQLGESETVAHLKRVKNSVYPDLETSWNGLRSELIRIAGEIHTVLVNARTTKLLEKELHSLSREERVAYQNRPVVMVGGNVLARGLTLNGLQVSYFLRKAGAADTLLQMGRWFGYRPNYDDLVRVWIDEEVVDLFAFVAEVQEELRESLARLKNLGLTPMDFGLRIRLHPEAFRITAANKARAGEVIHEGGVQVHGHAFSSLRLPSEAQACQRNHEAVEQLISRVTSGQGSAEDDHTWRQVPSGVIREFFTQFVAAHDDLFMAPAPKSSSSRMEQALHAAVNADHWDVKFIQGNGDEALIWTGLGKLRPSIRNKMSFTQEGSIQLANRRLAAERDLLNALPSTLRAKALSVRDSGDGGPIKLTETFIAREVLERPTMLIYALTAERDALVGSGMSEEQVQLLTGRPLPAVMVAFPALSDEDERSFTEEKATKFIANTVYQQNMLTLDDLEDDAAETDVETKN